MYLQVIREKKSHRVTVNHETDNKSVSEDEIGKIQLSSNIKL
jgi:hypothetical protein